MIEKLDQLRSTMAVNVLIMPVLSYCIKYNACALLLYQIQCLCSLIVSNTILLLLKHSALQHTTNKFFGSPLEYGAAVLPVCCVALVCLTCQLPSLPIFPLDRHYSQSFELVLVCPLSFLVVMSDCVFVRICGRGTASDITLGSMFTSSRPCESTGVFLSREGYISCWYYALS